MVREKLSHTTQFHSEGRTEKKKKTCFLGWWLCLIHRWADELVSCELKLEGLEHMETDWQWWCWLTGPAQTQLLCDHCHFQLCPLHGTHRSCTHSTVRNESNHKNKTLPSRCMRLLPKAGSFRALYLSLKASGVRVRLRSSLPTPCWSHTVKIWHHIKRLKSTGLLPLRDSPWYTEAW